MATVLLVISGLAMGLYQSLFFRFASFYAFPANRTGMIFSFFYIAYFVLAVPASLFHRRFGYKLGFILGLCFLSFSSFLFYFAVIEANGGFFFAAVLTLGASSTLLDTALTPLVVEVGNPATSVARLNIVYMFKSFGLGVGYVIAVVLYKEHFELTLQMATLYSARSYLLIGLGAMLLAYYVELIPLPSFERKDMVVLSPHQCFSLFHNKIFLAAATAILSVSAVLMILWSSYVRYHVSVAPGHVALFFERGWFWLIIGRIVGCILMRWVEPMRLLQWCIGLSIVAVIGAVTMGGNAGLVCLLSVSVFMSIQSPTLLGKALHEFRSSIRLGAGLLIAAGGIGSGLFAYITNLMLDIFLMDPRWVICATLPFLFVIMVCARIMSAENFRKTVKMFPAV